jgi:hypothetical protein
MNLIWIETGLMGAADRTNTRLESRADWMLLEIKVLIIDAAKREGWAGHARVFLEARQAV